MKKLKRTYFAGLQYAWEVELPKDCARVVAVDVGLQGVWVIYETNG